VTQAQPKRDYRAVVTVKGVNPNFPPGSGSLVEVDDGKGKGETRLHFKPLMQELQEQSGLPAEQWTGTEWEYDFFEHRLIKLLKK
jgi:hypothetical protein